MTSSCRGWNKVAMPILRDEMTSDTFRNIRKSNSGMPTSPRVHTVPARSIITATGRGPKWASDGVSAARHRIGAFYSMVIFVSFRIFYANLFRRLRSYTIKPVCVLRWHPMRNIVKVFSQWKTEIRFCSSANSMRGNISKSASEPGFPRASCSFYHSFIHSQYQQPGLIRLVLIY